MGLFSGILDFFGGNSRVEQQQNQTQTINKNTVAERGKVSGTRTGAVGGNIDAGTQVRGTQAFGDENLDILNELIATMSERQATGGSASPIAAGAAADAGRLSTLATDRVDGGFDVDRIVALSKQAATQSFADTDGFKTRQRQQALGARFGDTSSEQLENRSNERLATMLAGVEGEIRLKGNEQENQNILTATEASRRAGDLGIAEGNMTFNQLLESLNLGKGAEGMESIETLSTGEKTEDVTSNTVETEIMKELLNEVMTAQGTTTGTRSSTVLDFLNTLGSFRDR